MDTENLTPRQKQIRENAIKLAKRGGFEFETYVSNAMHHEGNAVMFNVTANGTRHRYVFDKNTVYIDGTKYTYDEPRIVALMRIG